jgi:hypothetical protein
MSPSTDPDVVFNRDPFSPLALEADRQIAFNDVFRSRTRAVRTNNDVCANPDASVACPNAMLTQRTPTAKFKSSVVRADNCPELELAPWTELDDAVPGLTKIDENMRLDDRKGIDP